MTPRLLLSLPRGSDGLPLASALEERVSRIVMILATMWITLVASWEMFGPVLAGHWAATASLGIIAENMLRWGIIGPVWEYVETKPGPESFYCHHPWGIFWVTAFFMKIIGRHEVLCRLAPVLLSAATPPLLYAVGRAMWRPASGAAAALGFVVLPITLAFAAHNGLEVPLMTWTLLALWGSVRLSQTNRRRYLLVSAFGLFMALHSDWPAFVLAGLLLGFWLVRGYLGGRGFFGRLDERRFAEQWITWATLSVLTGLFYLAVFHQAGKLGELLAIYGSRSSGNNMPLSAVLASRRYWIELSFTPIAIVLGKIAAILSVLRLFVMRRDVEFFPLAYLGMATFQYLVFKQGADIHVFWPQPFGPYFALGMGAIVATLASLVEFVWATLRARRGLSAEGSWAKGGVVALFVVMPLLAGVLRDGAPAVAYARRTGGRFNEKGNPIASDGDLIALLHDLASRLPKDAIVELHDGIRGSWSQIWALEGRVVKLNRPLPAPAPAVWKDKRYVLNSRFTPEDQLALVAGKFHVTAVGQFWVIDPREPAAPIDAFSFVEREPTIFEWMFVSATEPVRAIVADPWATWELRTHWNQEAPPPEGTPQTLEQKRIAHNMAIAQGDEARAAVLLADLMRELRPVGAAFEGGLEIVGARRIDGVHPRLDLYLRAPTPLPAGSFFNLRSRVLERARFSTTMADPTVREVGQPLAIPMARLRRGFLYVDPISIVKRPGTEVFQASWGTRRGQARIVGNAASTTVEVLKLD